MKKIIFFAVAIFVAGSFFLFNTEQVNAVKPSDYGLKEGDLISAIFSDDPDVYIINDQGYKRLFLNPEIFKFYGHLGGFVNVKLVTPEVRDAFITSGLFRNCEDNDQKVYGVDIEGEDSGQLHWVDATGEQAVQDDPDFFKKIFCINRKEFKWYPQGTEFRAVKEVPKYERIEPQGSAREITSEQGNIKEVGKVVICHYPPEAPNKFQEITIDASALKAHLEHGDSVGVCASTPQSSQPIYVTPAPPAPVSASNPIVLISPDKSGEWKMGQTYEIRWQQVQDAPITIELRNRQLRVEGDIPWYRITISSIFGKTGENIYNWTISSNLNPHTGYEICVSGSQFGLNPAFEDCDNEPYLYISGSGAGETMSALYSITVVSPSGGETWPTGSAQYIRWSGNVPITHKIMIIRLRDSAGKGAEYNLLTDTINDGLEQIIVPATLAAGYYTVEIKTLVNNETVFGRSNSPFSIVISTSTPTPISADLTPPTISNIRVVQGETIANSACVNFYWETNEPSKSTLVYAASPLTNQTHFSASAYNNYTTSHNLNGCDLSFNTQYYFKIYSTDVAGNTVESGEQIFTPTSTLVSTPIPTSVPAPTLTPTTQSNFSRNLTMGSTGSDVKQLQALLVNEVGYSADLITGYFGRITRDAVKRLQEKYGVKPMFGYFGELTRKALQALISN